MEILKKNIAEIFEKFKRLNLKIVTIFLAVAVLQTISWYFTSRRFYNSNLFFFVDNPNDQLIGFIYWFLSDSVTLLIIPAILIKYGFKEKIRSYGFSFGDYKFGLLISVLFLIPMIMIIGFISGFPEFQSVYPLLPQARESWTIFAIFEFSLLIYMFAWEFFWRGFMLFGLESEFGYYSIFIQMIPFVILHNGKPVLETFGAILGGIILGVLALKTRSYIYGVIIHYTVIFSLDLFTTLRYRASELNDNLSFLFKSVIKY